MGCGASTEDSKASAAIDKQLKLDAKRKESEVKMLLLGAGDSGKSTLARQMKLLFLNGFAQSELQFFAPLLRLNCIGVFRKPVLASLLGEAWLGTTSDTMELTDEQSMEAAVWGDLKEAALRVALTPVSALPIDEEIPDELVADYTALLGSDVFKDLVLRGADYGLDDNASYLYKRYKAIAQRDYVPSMEDVLRMRIVTTTIQETVFVLESYSFRIVDVGGQRNERRKWIHSFSNVTAIIYVAAVHEYDMKLVEDANVNRMHESLSLFDDMVNCEYFKDIPFILFLNKVDLMKEKLKRGITPAIIFPDYKGGTDYDKCIAFIKRKFESLAQRERAHDDLYMYETVAIDTDNVDLIFKTVKTIILSQTLSQI